MMNSMLVEVEEQIVPTIKTALGKDLNYTTFSSWYGRIKDRMESSNHITENLFMQVLEKLGAISRKNGKTYPPVNVYEQMRGSNGRDKVNFYCKKFSNIAGKHIESYGICINRLQDFEEMYLEKTLAILNDIEKQCIEEEEYMANWLRERKEKSSDKTKWKRYQAQARMMLKEAKEYIVRDVLKGTEEDNEL